jgi:small subunit ribosomal protein S2
MAEYAIDLKDLFERGVHFGHLARRWNPKMKPYIHKAQDGIHVIDLTQTKSALEEAHAYLRDLVAQGGIVLFVGTKKQAKDQIKKVAQELGMPYVTERWVGGLLTNWDGVKTNIQKLIQYKKSEAPKNLTKKELKILDKRMVRLESIYEGLLSLEKLPDALFVLDTRKERLAVAEAVRMKIAVVGVCDTNADPSDVSLVIPANDDAVKSVEFLIEVVADAVRKGSELKATSLEQKNESDQEEQPKKAVKRSAKKKADEEK